MSDLRWIRVTDPSLGWGWRCGRAAITDEILYSWPRDEVQRIAVEMTGVELPADEVWPPEPEPPLMHNGKPVRSVADMEAAILDLLSRPRRDDLV